jgi:hypothetical protein
MTFKIGNAHHCCNSNIYSTRYFILQFTLRLVEVPVGTLVRNPEGALICDLERGGCMFVAARGGAGGKGNAHFKSATSRTPRVAEVGADGETLDYTLELRYVNFLNINNRFYPRVFRITNILHSLEPLSVF